jgi:type I site-specific restriction-modification system R (restriction) subunit
MKYIYLIQSLEEGYYKIGVSKNPSKRIEQLQTGNASKLKLIDTFQSKKADKVERILQRRYSHFHKNGEWFELSIGQEVSFRKDCQLIEETLGFLEKNNNVFI